MERTGRTLLYFKRYLTTKSQPFTTKCQTLNNATLGSSNFSTEISTNHNHCWKCGIVKNSLDMFCEKCHSIQAPMQKNNYFKVLGVEEGFNVDTKLLKDKFRKVQSLIHPDKFSNR